MTDITVKNNPDIKLLTRDMLAASAAERWKKQYFKKDYQKSYWLSTRYGDSEKVYKQLKHLCNYSPTPEAVNKVIGNDSWTRLKCSCCEKEVEKVVTMPAIASDEYGDSRLCFDCIEQAWAVIRKTRRIDMTDLKRYLPKFNVGDVVYMHDDFSFNSAYEVISIGKIEAIHITYGKGMFRGEDKRGTINYSISGFSLRPEESRLNLWKGE